MDKFTNIGDSSILLKNTEVPQDNTSTRIGGDSHKQEQDLRELLKSTHASYMRACMDAEKYKKLFVLTLFLFVMSSVLAVVGVFINVQG